MPRYDFQCVDCGNRDTHLAGVDDYTVICGACGGLMVRLDEECFTPYFAVPILLQEESDEEQSR